MHLVPAGDAARGHPGVEQLVGAAQQRVDCGSRRVALLERAVGELGEVPGGGRALERIAERQPGMTDADLGDDVERPAAREGDRELGERLEAAAEPRGRPPDALGDRP